MNYNKRKGEEINCEEYYHQFLRLIYSKEKVTNS
jgi:hypothetical protein